jgi:hypothetical protein
MAEPVPTVTPTRTSNTLHRRVVVIGTVFSLAVAYGWMASFERQPGGEMAFRWGWPTLVWCLIGIGSCLYFWRKIWPPDDRSRPKQPEIIIGSLVLLLPGLWWLTLPLRFLKGQTLRDVSSGLVVAALVLSFGAWIITRLVKAFEHTDAEDLANEDKTQEGESEAEPGDRNKSRGS